MLIAAASVQVQVPDSLSCSRLFKTSRRQTPSLNYVVENAESWAEPFLACL